MASRTEVALPAEGETKSSEAGWFNLGGPGWFNDVFECEIQLDSTRKVALKGFLFEQNVPLFRSDEKITGKSPCPALQPN